MRRLDRTFDVLANRGHRSDPDDLIDRLERRLVGEPEVVQISGRQDMAARLRISGRLARLIAVAAVVAVVIGFQFLLPRGEQPPSAGGDTSIAVTGAVTTVTFPGEWNLDALAARQAGPVPAAATCPAGSAPDVPGSLDAAHPPAAEHAPAVFDRQSGVVVYQVGTDTWALDVCSNAWQLMNGEGPQLDDTAYGAMAYDADSDVVVAFHDSDVWTYDYDTNAWTTVGFGDPPLRGQARYHGPSGLILVVDDVDVWAYDVENRAQFRLGTLPTRGLLAYEPMADEFYLYQIPRNPYQHAVTWRLTGDSGWATLPIGTPRLEFAFGDLFNGREITVDESLHRVVIVSGGLAAVFDPVVPSWNMDDWTTTGGPGSGFPASVVWDPLNERLIALGGRYRHGDEWGASGEVWAFDVGTRQWTQLLASEE